MKLVEAIRAQPWSMQPILDFADEIDATDPARARLARLQVKIAQLDRSDTTGGELANEVKEILAKYEARWKLPLGELAPFAELKFGLIDSITIDEATDEQASLLAAATELRVLRLNNPQLSSVGYQSIARLPQLDALIIEGEEISNEHISQLEDLPTWTAIRLYLDHDVSHLDAMNERRIEKFDSLSPDEQLSAACRFLVQCQSGDRLDEIPTDISFDNAEIRDPEMKLLNGLPRLKKIRFCECFITPAGLANLASRRELVEIDLQSTDVESITPLTGMTSLRNLSIFPSYNVVMTDDGLKGLETLTGLEELELRDEEIYDATVRRLAPLTNLRRLELSVAGLDDEGSLAALETTTKLEHLVIHGAQISDQALRHLRNLEHLQYLWIDIPKGDGAGFAQLSGLQRLDQLRLSGRGVTDNALANLNQMPNLVSINAAGSAATIPGARQLASQLANVTIAVADGVVKSPRATYEFIRSKLIDSVSLLLPVGWIDIKQSHTSNSLSIREDGWEAMAGMGGEQFGPAEVSLSIRKNSTSPQDAVRGVCNAYGSKLLHEDVQAFAGRDDGASCIYECNDCQHFFTATPLEENVLIFQCSAPTARFDEFLTMFLMLAESARIDDDSSLHPAETVTIPAEEIMPFTEA